MAAVPARAFAIAAGVLVLAACHRPAPPSVRAIKVVVLPYLTFAPVFIASDEGYFAQEGLSIEFVQLRTSAEAIPALVQGRVDVVGGSIGVGFLNAVARGARIRAVADKGYVDGEGCAAQGILAARPLAADGALAALVRTRRLSIAVNRASYNLYYTELALGAFFPVLVSTMAGVRQISPIYFEVAQNFGASRTTVLARVVIPGSLPLALAGARLALNAALMITIAVELLAADRGLGAIIWSARETLRLEELYVGLVITAAMGLLFNGLLRVLAARLTPWQAERIT